MPNPSSTKWEIKATLAPRETYFFQSVNTVWNTPPKPKAFQNYVKRKVMFLKWLLLKKSLKDWETYSVVGGSGDSWNMKEEAVGEVPRPIICHRIKSKVYETPNVSLHTLNHIIEDAQLQYLYYFYVTFNFLGCNISFWKQNAIHCAKCETTLLERITSYGG